MGTPGKPARAPPRACHRGRWAPAVWVGSTVWVGAAVRVGAVVWVGVSAPGVDVSAVDDEREGEAVEAAGARGGGRAGVAGTEVEGGRSP